MENERGDIRSQSIKYKIIMKELRENKKDCLL